MNELENNKNKTKKEHIEICYLCGKKLNSDIDSDHVPPKQFYPSEIRKRYNLDDLFTLPTHKTCNKSYQSDEDYFVCSFVILAVDSYSGSSLWEDTSKRVKRKMFGERIGMKILKEFDRRPGGIILPQGKIVKRFDGKRIVRVIWKITRGLFFKEKSQFLYEGTPKFIDIFSPDEKPSEEFFYLNNCKVKGRHPRVFDYKCGERELPEPYCNFHLWAMLFWERIITVIGFHDPKCSCDTCKNSKMKETGLTF